MNDKIKIGQLYPNAMPKANVRRTNVPAASFQQVYQEKLIHVSHHAELRLEQRGIQIQPDQMAKIGSAIDKAAAKGAKDSLILINNMALIVNVKNRTIVTAMEGTAMQDNVFTQIDSAVIIP